jgi:aminoglycoside 3-N-acetyltransferase I
MRIERIGDAAAVHQAADLFDSPPLAAPTERFLAEPGHHLLFAYDDEAGGGGAARAVGMISGVEMTHPDKGTEMFIYELGVAPAARLRGVATALIRALAGIARERGCYGVWVGTETGNDAALATYRRAGADEEAPFVLLSWDLLTGDAP